MESHEKEVLLLDDEPGFHDLFRPLLAPLGYAIIFLDIHMPKMLGTDALGKIKEMKPYQAKGGA